jgi:hypothetical protein
LDRPQHGGVDCGGQDPRTNTSTSTTLTRHDHAFPEFKIIENNVGTHKNDYFKWQVQNFFLTKHLSRKQP